MSDARSPVARPMALPHVEMFSAGFASPISAPVARACCNMALKRELARRGICKYDVRSRQVCRNRRRLKIGNRAVGVHADELEPRTERPDSENQMVSIV